jgi:alanyl-tRNA synthetase
MLNSKAHSAGHILQAVVEKLNIGLKAVKGYHFPDGSFVQFAGPKPLNVGDLIKSVNARLSMILTEDYNVEIKMVSFDEISLICPDLPYSLPEGKPLRVVKICSIGNYVPCGGTHIAHLRDINKIEVAKIKVKDGDVRINYLFN